MLQLPPGADARAGEILAAHGVGADDPFIVVHPGSARAEKYWLPARWAEVITFCQRELGRRCVLTGGRDAFEQEHLAQIRAALAASGQTCPDLSGQLDLTALAAVLARAALCCRGGLGADAPCGGVAASADRAFRADEPLPLAAPAPPRARVLQAGHGDAPVDAFQAVSPGGPMDGVSTQAVIDCIKAFPPVSPRPVVTGPALVRPC